MQQVKKISKYEEFGAQKLAEKSLKPKWLRYLALRRIQKDKDMLLSRELGG